MGDRMRGEERREEQYLPRLGKTQQGGVYVGEPIVHGPQGVVRLLHTCQARESVCWKVVIVGGKA